MASKASGKEEETLSITVSTPQDILKFAKLKLGYNLYHVLELGCERKLFRLVIDPEERNSADQVNSCLEIFLERLPCKSNLDEFYHRTETC